MGNAALCGAPRLGFPPCATNVAVSNSRRKVHLLKYILPATVGTVILVASCCLLFLSRRYKRTPTLAPTNTQSLADHKMISYHELVRATDNFCEANLLGRGSFGSVFRGRLDDGSMTAIKVLDIEVKGALKSFEAECRALGMIRHRNIVKILSTCSNLDFKALVLQFMPNGSLERWLYSHNYYLNLLQRINIMLDVASALEYLHHHHSHVVVHCDLKPSNVLLDESMTAHVGDFGIAKLWLGHSKSMESTNVRGTFGYIAPEYASTGRVSRTADVYSFGILLLETFTRKKPNDAIFDGKLNLRQWVYEACPTGVLDVVDGNLLKEKSGNGWLAENQNVMHQCLSSILDLGLLCSRDSAKERILMKEVTPKLQKIKMEFSSEFSSA